MKTIDDKLFIRLRAASAKLEALLKALESGVPGPYLSRREAYDIYGKQQIQDWLREDLVKLEKPGQPGPMRLHKIWLDTLPVLAEVETCLKIINAAQDEGC